MLVSGHLDRVVTGMVAQEILEACEDMGGAGEGSGTSGGGGGGDGALANPALGNYQILINRGEFLQKNILDLKLLTLINCLLYFMDLFDSELLHKYFKI